MTVVAVLATIGVACGGDTPTSGSHPEATQITVGDNYFTPTSVTISPGDTVIWIWGGAVGHNVIFTTAPTTPPADCGVMSSGLCFRIMPSTTGTYNYVCSLHAGMAASITIQ